MTVCYTDTRGMGRGEGAAWWEKQLLVPLELCDVLGLCKGTEQRDQAGVDQAPRAPLMRRVSGAQMIVPPHGSHCSFHPRQLPFPLSSSFPNTPPPPPFSISTCLLISPLLIPFFPSQSTSHFLSLLHCSSPSVSRILTLVIGIR